MINRSMHPGAVSSRRSKLASPCVRNCCLDENDICLGCGRELDEITGWNAASESEKQDILKRAQQRLVARSKQVSLAVKREPREP